MPEEKITVGYRLWTVFKLSGFSIEEMQEFKVSLELAELPKFNNISYIVLK